MEQLATVSKGRVHSVWQSPPQLATGKARRWWNLMATAGLSSRASDEYWNKFCIQLDDTLISPPGDLNKIGANRIEQVSGDPDTSHMEGKQS